MGLQTICLLKSPRSGPTQAPRTMSPPMHAMVQQPVGSSTLHSFDSPSRLPRSRPPRVLVLSVSAGNGHLRAAEALELALRRTVPDAVVKNVDVLSLSIRVFRYCYGQVYVDLIDVAPQVLG